jgi:hypothetical protein
LRGGFGPQEAPLLRGSFWLLEHEFVEGAPASTTLASAAGLVSDQPAVDETLAGTLEAPAVQSRRLSEKTLPEPLGRPVEAEDQPLQRKREQVLLAGQRRICGEQALGPEAVTAHAAASRTR